MSDTPNACAAGSNRRVSLGMTFTAALALLVPLAPLRLEAAGLTPEGKSSDRRVVSDAAVSFRNDVEPLLTRLGCNQGACHGSQHGKGGFKLSLLGFEPEFDHAQIVKSAEGRRVTPFAPEESLLLKKPIMDVAHLSLIHI